MTFAEFLRRFPSSDACLDDLKNRHWSDGTPCPKCRKPSRFHRLSGRSAYSCQFCGHHIYPTSGTIFHKSTTSLQLWYWAIYLISSSKCGISAKQLEREIGVTYKTAHRMLKQIRTLLGDDSDGPTLTGEVEVDETFMTGRLRNSDRRRRQREGVHPNTPRYIEKPESMIVAAVERHGLMRASVAGNRGKATLHGMVKEFVLPESMIFTDEHALYNGIDQHYQGHKRVQHKASVYVDDDGAGTQNVESFFALFKNSVRGAHHNVSTKYLQAYLDEYTFRWNRRKNTGVIFWEILERVRPDRLAAA